MRDVLLIFTICCIFSVNALLPTCLRQCPRRSIHVVSCVMEMIQDIQPKLQYGAPELSIPRLEPYHLDEALLNHIRVTGHLKNVDLYGGSKFKVADISIDFEEHIYEFTLRFDELRSTGQYMFRCVVFQIPWRGSGTYEAFMYGVQTKLTLHGREVYRNGVSKMQFHTCKLTVSLDDYEVRMRHGWDILVSWTAQAMFRFRKGLMLDMARPFIQKTGCKLVMDGWNKIVRKINWNELFPNVEYIPKEAPSIAVVPNDYEYVPQRPLEVLNVLRGK